MVVPKILHYAVELRAVRPKVDFSRPPVVYTNDLRSAEFQFEITDMSVTDLSTATATTLLYMRDGSFFQNPKEDVGLVGTTFSYTLKENEGNHAGIAKIQLVVCFNEGLVNEQNFPTQLYEFEIINGLETKVAQEVMIYDWTILTRDARAYIDQFVADEMLRDAEFDNNEFDRNAAFQADQTNRTNTFNQSETDRTTAYGIAEGERNDDYTAKEALRQAGYDADHSRADTDHTNAGTDRTNAATDRTNAATDRTNAASDRSLAAADHTRADNDHTRADADSQTVAGFNTRLQAEETATAANKISAIKAKTFADVDARFEDIEFDTAMMGTNLVTNGDFSNGSNWWGPSGGTFSVSNGISTFTATTQWGGVLQSIQTVTNNSYYVRGLIFGTTDIYFGRNTSGKYLPYNGLCAVSTIFKATGSSALIGIGDRRASDWTPVTMDNVIAIDLTATFGAGNEPTVEQMDTVMAKFTNSWFDGTKNLFRANATLNKLMAVDARTEFEAKNDVTNGDFSNGTTGWAPAGSTIAVANNELAVTQSIDWNSRAITTPAFVTSGTNMFYISANVKATVNTVGINLDSYAVGVKYHSGSGAYERLSAIVANTNQSHNLYVVDKGTLAVPARTSYVKNAIVINLTATFGAGKEPTLVEMDRLMARFPNSWFDGVKPIQTIETLYQEKANKVQEAWITPTLQNGWTDFSTSDTSCQYFIDAFGCVHLKGMIKGGAVGVATNIFVLPSGYRPPKNLWIPIVTSGTFGVLVITLSGTVYVQSGMVTSYVSFGDEIIFKTS